MANYNSGFTYNSRVNYNSSTLYIVEISDAGVGTDAMLPKSAIINMSDSGHGEDAIDLLQKTVRMADSGIGQDTMTITNTLSTIVETGHGTDALLLVANVLVADSGSGTDSIGEPKKYPASKYFLVTTDQILQPLGVRVLGDSREDLMPEAEDISEEIPGRHKELSFGSKLKARPLELHVATPDGLSPLEKKQFQRKCAMYLNPMAGTKKLIYQDDEGIEYEVKYVGKIPLTGHPSWFDFVIPLKLADPFAYDNDPSILIGSGTLINSGTFETGVIVEIQGPDANPSITIGDEVLAYTGTINSDQTLVIDTEKMTAKIGNQNAMGGYNGDFPMIQPGSVNVTAGSNVTIRLINKWL